MLKEKKEEDTITWKQKVLQYLVILHGLSRNIGKKHGTRIALASLKKSSTTQSERAVEVFQTRVQQNYSWEMLVFLNQPWLLIITISANGS